MKNPKPFKFSLKTTLLVVGVLSLFSLVSTVHLFMQMHSNLEPIAGQITDITENEITIMDKSGRQTVLFINEQTKMRDSFDDLAPGLFVHSFGTRINDESFQSKGIRIIKKP